MAGTGPYRIASYRDDELTLVRNPYFREWSRAAQPDGYPDRIVWRLNVDTDDALDQVERGDADWFYGWSLTEPHRTELARVHPGQLHTNPVAATIYYVLNVNVPPFDDVRVRRALNLAIDRDQLVRLYGGDAGAAPTCQVLPPQLPGYRRYCPYPHDLARARALIAASGTRGARVTLWQTPEPELIPTDAVLLRALRRLGYRPAKKIVSDPYSARVTGNSDYRVQVSGGGGWYADYPAASNFLELKFSCSHFRPATDYQDNAGGFATPRWIPG